MLLSIIGQQIIESSEKSKYKVKKIKNIRISGKKDKMTVIRSNFANITNVRMNAGYYYN